MHSRGSCAAQAARCGRRAGKQRRKQRQGRAGLNPLEFGSRAHRVRLFLQVAPLPGVRASTAAPAHLAPFKSSTWRKVLPRQRSRGGRATAGRRYAQPQPAGRFVSLCVWVGGVLQPGRFLQVCRARGTHNGARARFPARVFPVTTRPVTTTRAGKRRPHAGELVVTRGEPSRPGSPSVTTRAPAPLLELRPIGRGNLTGGEPSSRRWR